MPSVKNNIKKSTTLKQVNHVRGSLKPGEARFAIILAQFNEYFTNMLAEGAVDALSQHGVKPSNIDVIHVPGAFEIPIVVKRILKKKKYDCLITAGMVIRGKTRHFNHVVDAAAQGTMQAALESNIPVIHGVIAAENYQQAIDRCGGKLGHKGREAAKTAIEMVGLLKKIK